MSKHRKVGFITIEIVSWHQDSDAIRTIMLGSPPVDFLNPEISQQGRNHHHENERNHNEDHQEASQHVVPPAEAFTETSKQNSHLAPSLVKFALWE